MVAKRTLILTSGMAEDGRPFVLAPDEPDVENPEWTEADFARARPVTDFPELIEILNRHGKMGRPPLPEGQRKQRVTLHLDRDVLERLKADGAGWQTRANAALRKALGLDG
jgi:uncharacterized protein (DUF4415 family)